MANLLRQGARHALFAKRLAINIAIGLALIVASLFVGLLGYRYFEGLRWFSFLLVRLVAPLSFKDVLHLSFYPIGAGIFVGAAFALVASVVIRSLVDVGYIPDIKFDFSQWGEDQQVLAVTKRVLYDCLKNESLAFTVVASGLEEPYTNLRPPIDDLSYLRPVIAVLYLIIAARIFMVAVDRRKALVFSLVLFAALLATGANVASLAGYIHWKDENSSCKENLVQPSLDRMAESALNEFSKGLTDLNNDMLESSVHAEGRALVFRNRFKRPMDMDAYNRSVSVHQKNMREVYCLDDNWFLRSLKATETFTYYSPEGERLTSFSIGPADCSRPFSGAR